jgi:hypothetical protein
MSVESKIINNCKLKQRTLLRAATVASQKPDTGVEIKNKSAFFVIRDCADITQKYLVHMCYASYGDPIVELRGQFTEKEIIDFVARCDKHSHLRQLLYIMFTDIARKDGLYEKVVTNQPEELDLTEDADDIYGDYDYVEEPPKPAVPQEIPTSHIDINDGSVVISKLVDVFNAK